MKTFIFVSVVLCTLILGSVTWTSTAATDVGKQKAVAEFDSPIIVRGSVLKGTYLFVHDDAAMNRGEACTYIYKGVAEVRNNLVVSFHCIHVERTRAKKFIWRARDIVPGTLELIEFQFSGETAGHAVPTSENTAVVPVAN